MGQGRHISAAQAAVGLLVILMGRRAAKFPYCIPGVSVFRRADRPTGPWLASYRDPATGRLRIDTLSTYTDISARRARDISRRLDEVRLGLVDARLEAAAAAPATELLDLYRDHLAGLYTRKQADQVKSRAGRVLGLAGVRSVNQIAGDAIQRVVCEEGARRSWSPATKNQYIKAVRSFCRWLRLTGRLSGDPMQAVRLHNAATDVRHPRRALTMDELSALCEAAAAGPAFDGITGAERRMIYLVAAHTGLRKSEIASLAPASFSLAGDRPTITVSAACSKHRREDVQLIRPDLAALLAEWISGREPGRPVFRLPERAYRMIQMDLAAAGIPYQDDAGAFADFHSLRHTYVTFIVQSGESLRVAQDLARLSDPRLLSRYGHVSLHDRERALDSLPPVPGAAADDQQGRAAG